MSVQFNFFKLKFQVEVLKEDKQHWKNIWNILLLNIYV